MDFLLFIKSSFLSADFPWTPFFCLDCFEAVVLKEVDFLSGDPEGIVPNLWFMNGLLLQSEIHLNPGCSRLKKNEG